MPSTAVHELICRQYFTHLAAQDWDALGALLTSNVAYSLRGSTPLPHEVQGRDEFIAMSKQVFARFASTRFDDVIVKAMAGGLGMYVATYRGSWLAADGTRNEGPGRVVFQLVRDRIARIAVLLTDDQLEAVAREWTANPPS